MTSTTLTEKCCLIAQPVAGNPTHFMVERAFAEAGLDWRFMSFEVAPENLGDAMRGIRALGLRGVKVVRPHQVAVLEYLDELTDSARLSGSVNCVTDEDGRLIGDSTEGTALVELLSEQEDLSGQRVMVLGAGRLAQTLAVALGRAGVASITIASRSQDRGKRLVDQIESNTSATASLVTVDAKETIKIEPDTSLLVDATSRGTATPNATLPLDATATKLRGTVVDVTYSSSDTWLTRRAAELDCRVISGVELYVRQMALALRNWTGSMPDTDAMREAAEEFLGL